MFRLRQFWALTKLTAQEVVRQPVCLMLTVACVVLMALASVQSYQFGEEGKFVRDSAFAIYFVFGALVAGYAACTTLSGELRIGTAQVVLSKPVSTDVFFISKFAGIALLILLYSACAMPACLLSEKAAQKLYVTDALSVGILLAAPAAALVLAGVANYSLRRPFASTAFWLLLIFLAAGLFLSAAMHDQASEHRIIRGHAVHVATAIQWRLVPAGLLISAALTVLAAFALALATRLDTIPVLAISGVILFGGLLSDHFFGQSASIGGVLAYRIVPNWQRFWMTDALTGGGTIAWSYFGTACVYAAFHLSAVLVTGMLSFRYREAK